VLHDFTALGKVLDRIERDDAEAVVVVPVWPSRPFWGRLRSGSWPQRIAHTLLLGPGSIVANAENAESCFFQGTFNSKLLVLRTRRLGRSGGAAVSAAGGAAEAGGAEEQVGGVSPAAAAEGPEAKRARTGKPRPCGRARRAAAAVREAAGDPRHPSPI
jgi:hypothetical protein